jgi:AcrR family transcriptional regulator
MDNSKDTASMSFNGAGTRQRPARQRRAAKENTRLSAEDWLQLALDVLNEQGIDAVKVLPLAKRLGVTRGSFYHHFESREDLLTQMLDYWEEFLTNTVIKQAKKLDAPAAVKIRDVVTNVLLNRHDRYDTAIIAWSRIDQAANSTHDRVVRKRLRFLNTMLCEAGLHKDDARFRARLLMSLLIVYNDGLPALSKRDVEREIDQCMELILSK